MVIRVVKNGQFRVVIRVVKREGHSRNGVFFEITDKKITLS